MNKNSKLIVLIAVIAIGAIVLVYNVIGSGSEETNNPATNNSSTTTPSNQPTAQDNTKELTDLEGQVKNSPTDAKYADTYMRIAQIYFDKGMEGKFSGNAQDSKVPFEKAVENFELAAKCKESADAHAGIGASLSSLQALSSYYPQLKDDKQVKTAGEELNKALKLDAKNQQALYYSIYYAIYVKADNELASKYLKEIKSLKLDPAFTKEVEKFESKIKEGNFNHNDATSGSTGTGTDTTTPSTSGGQLPAGHPSTGGAK
jgi:tetratricopeptide (TPR) repeat protein